MNIEDINRIETELNIKLPDIYKLKLTTIDYKEIEDFKNNQDCYIWDDPSAIIKRNKEIRSNQGIYKDCDWPNNLFFIGDPLNCSAYAIELDSDKTNVHWVDHYKFDKDNPNIESQPFDVWFDEYISDYEPNSGATFKDLLILIAIGIIILAGYLAYKY